MPNILMTCLVSALFAACGEPANHAVDLPAEPTERPGPEPIDAQIDQHGGTAPRQAQENAKSQRALVDEPIECRARTADDRPKTIAHRDATNTRLGAVGAGKDRSRRAPGGCNSAEP